MKRKGNQQDAPKNNKKQKRNNNQKAPPPPPPVESSSSSEPESLDDDEMGGLDVQQQMEIQSQLESAIAELLPQMKRHLGSPAARVLKDKLTQLVGAGDIMEQFEENLELAHAIVASWETVVLPSYTEAEKKAFRGRDAEKEWSREIVEEEIKLGKTLFLLEELNMPDSDDESEDDTPKVDPATVTIDTCRKLKKIFVSDEVEDNIRGIMETLESETEGGLENLSATSIPTVIEFWLNVLDGANTCFTEKDYSEAFITLLALSVCMFRLEVWVAECTDQATVGGVLGKLGKAWKQALAQSVDKLGFSGEKKDLIEWLNKHVEELKSLNPKVPKFEWKLV